MSFFLIGSLTEKAEDGSITRDGFYPTVFICSLVGFVWIYMTVGPVSKLENAPLSIWKVRKALYKDKDSEDDELGLLLSERSEA